MSVLIGAGLDPNWRLGPDTDPGNINIVQQFAQAQVPDHIGSAQAWYNCCSDNAVTHGQDLWARCTGRYRQTQSLGIGLGTGPEMLHTA